MTRTLQCIWCRHFNRGRGRGVYTCSAFPEGIPDPIIDGKFDHSLPYQGDNGIRFEKMDISKLTPSTPAS